MSRPDTDALRAGGRAGGRAGAGVGRQLLDAVAASARAAGAARLLVMTTNDNLAALRFYQRRGFRLADLRPGAVDEARAKRLIKLHSLDSECVGQVAVI